MRMAGAGTTSASDVPDELVISIRSRIAGLSPPSDCCIFTVPKKLRRNNKEAYTPRVVAIGPYHRLNPSLMPMEDHKLRYLQNFLGHSQGCNLEDYVKEVKSWEDEARNCYDKKIELNSDQFAEMMLLDSIFVIQLFLTDWKSRGERIFNKPGMIEDIMRDMALLENQLPYFVIQRLFEMAFRTHQKDVPGLLELACSFFGPVMRMEKLPEAVMELEEVKHFVDLIGHSFLPLVGKAPNKRNKKIKFPPSVTQPLAAGVKHFVDVIRLLFFCSAGKAPNKGNEKIEFPPSATQLVGKAPNKRNEKIKFPPSATQLVAAGVKLRRGESECLFDIEFENGVLKIPCLVLDDWTESYFRNIIAFEQCCYSSNTYLTDYIGFMDQLVDTPGDAELLIDKEIIENWLSNKEAVAQLINNFAKEILLSENYRFSSLSDKLIKHCQWPYNKWKATLKRDYCSSPWVVISVIAAVLLLLLTIAQTVCSVLSLV